MISKEPKATILTLRPVARGAVLFLVVVSFFMYLDVEPISLDINYIFYDEVRKKNFLEALDAENIPYLKDKNGSIWHSMKYKERVMSLRSEMDSKCPVIFEVYDSDVWDQFMVLLDDKGVEYETSNIENGGSLCVNVEYQSLADEALKQAVESR